MSKRRRPGPSLDMPPVQPLAVPEPGDAALSVELSDQLRQVPVCTHCGGRHSRACPRVKLMQFHPSGALSGVEFWPDGQWSDEHVIWPEQLAEADE